MHPPWNYIGPENWWLEGETFLLEWPIFEGYISCWYQRVQPATCMECSYRLLAIQANLRLAWLVEQREVQVQAIAAGGRCGCWGVVFFQLKLGDWGKVFALIYKIFNICKIYILYLHLCMYPPEELWMFSLQTCCKLRGNLLGVTAKCGDLSIF